MNLKKMIKTVIFGLSMFSLFAMKVFAESGAGDAAGEGGATPGIFDNWLMWILLPAMLVLMYFFMIRPQRKRDKETAKMRSSLEIGDEVVTIGGIIGRVVTIKDDDVITIETGSDKTKVRIRKWAIQERLTVKGD